jgi:UDP-N-acetylmuramyl pentapeptide phosphotransferase/UDP-N-acetylglucosamine-1-phosphate transferase
MAGFLLFNLHPAKIFLGDSGSLLLGLLAYVFAVRILQTPDEALWANVSRPVAAMAILAYPLVDTLRVFTLRVLKRQSPFSPDRKHIHHLLMKLGWGHRLSSAAIWSYSVLFAVLAFQPQNVQMGWTGTLQFLGTLGLAFGVGTVPALLVKRGWGRSALSDTMPAESAAKATTESQPVA